METIKINPLKINASRICLGTWAIGGWLWGGSDTQQSIKTIHAALDYGINTIDTAPVYGFGQAEEIVGKALQQYGKRDQIIIATKVGLDWHNGKVYRNSSPQRIAIEIEDSLKRLGTDYIDLYQIHWPDSLVAFEKTAEILLQLMQQGKIAAIGVSNFNSQQMEQFLKVAPIHSSQPPYNLFERGIENDIFPFSEKNNIITLAYGALCRGLLSGKITTTTQFNGDDIRKIDPKFQPPILQQYLNATNKLEQFAQENYKKNVLQLAIRWILDRGKTIALWGARRPEQLQAMNGVMGWYLDKNAMQQIDKILAETITTPVGPEFMAPPHSK